MKQAIIHISLIVRDYDEALEFYVGKLGFELVEDTFQPEQDKRWVVVAPTGFGEGSGSASILLAKASNPQQLEAIGKQGAGRVFLFLNSDDFWRDHKAMTAKGIKFVREPKQADYGWVAVFEDLYGNHWDLLELNEDHPMNRL